MRRRRNPILTLGEDILGDMKKTAEDSLNFAIQGYKDKYLTYAKLKAKYDLDKFKSLALKNEIDNYWSILFSKYNVGIYQGYHQSAIQYFKPRYSEIPFFGASFKIHWLPYAYSYGGNVTIENILSAFNEPLMALNNPDAENAFNTPNTVAQQLAYYKANQYQGNPTAIKEAVGAWQRLQANPDDVARIKDYIEKAKFLLSEMYSLLLEMGPFEAQIKALQVNLDKALTMAHQYIENLPSLTELLARIEQGLDPIPKPVVIPDVIAVTEPVAELPQLVIEQAIPEPVVMADVTVAKKSILPWVAAGGVALFLLGRNK